MQSTSFEASSSKHCVTNFGRAECQHRKLLSSLIEAIAELSERQSQLSRLTDGWLQSTTNGLLRLNNCIEQIFQNGLRARKPDNSPDCWRFIEGLNWINPHMTVSIASNNRLPSPTIHIPFTRIRNDKSLAWIYENIESNSLSTKLKYLLSDPEHLANCYEITAYLQQERYVRALFVCLKAVETQDFALLTQINANLHDVKCEDNDRAGNSSAHRQHRRSTSFPIFAAAAAKSLLIANEASPSSITMGHTSSLPLTCDSTDTSRRSSLTIEECPTGTCDQLNVISTPSRAAKVRKVSERKLRKQGSRIRHKCKHSISLRIRPWASLPNINGDLTGSAVKSISRSHSQPIRIEKAKIRLTVENIAIKERQKVPSFSINQATGQRVSSPSLSRPSNSESTSPNERADAAANLQPINLVKCDDIKIHFDRRHAPHALVTVSSSLTASSTATEVQAGSSPTSKPNRQFTEFFKYLPGKKNIFGFLDDDDPIDGVDKGAINSAPGDFVSGTFMPRIGEKIDNRYGNKFLEDVVSDPSPTAKLAQISKLQPTRGQSLASYLQASQVYRFNCTDLERENAHFSLSDAIISAIEEIKCGNKARLQEKRNKATIAATKKIRKHRRLKNWVEQSEVQGKGLGLSAIELSTSNASLSGTSSHSSSSSSESDSELSHISSNSSQPSNGGDLKYLQIFSVSSHSINDHAAYAEWAENSNESLSAEGIALSLISKFKDRQLPRATDLLYNQFDQQFNAMNTIYDGACEDVYQLPYTRGTSDWAPPRAQIIFTRHPAPDRKKLLQLQNHKCAGCGMQVASTLSHSYRYCEYLGKYHCTGCHRNQISTVPARVLERWDFSCHPVSVFAYRLLDQIWKVPLFRIPDLNGLLYEKVRALRMAHWRRMQLNFIKDFIKLCRFADELKNNFDCIPSYIVDDIDTWCMNDLVAVRNGTFMKDLHEIIQSFERHIFNCELCTARGFICELCPFKQVIFPWQTKVTRCDKCGACFHSSCWRNVCSKCQRLEQRKKNSVGSKS